ncbi:MAG TPA: FUSC family protein, partial [Prolixibacteraceae bacterium]|nr:FUSC family protein [Prolixibacteraceae bacterium]
MLKRLKTIIEDKKKDILRLSLRSAIAAVLTYVIISYIKPDQAFLAILSSVFIINYNIGGTLSAAKNRFLATLLGCILGFLAVWLLPSGWGTSVALAVSMLLLNAIAAVKSEWRYGV